MNPYNYFFFGILVAYLILSVGLSLGAIAGSFVTVGYLRWRVQRGLTVNVLVWVIPPSRLADFTSPYPQQHAPCLPPPPPLLNGPRENE